MNNTYAWVVRQMGDYLKGKVLADNIVNLKWDMVSGGTQKYTGIWGLYGYIYCNQIIEGEIGHSGIHGSCPHYIKIFIQKCDNEEEVYNALAKQAGKKPIESWRGKHIAEKVREKVADNPGILATDVATILEQEGITEREVKNAIRYLKKYKFKRKLGLISEKSGRTQKLSCT